LIFKLITTSNISSFLQKDQIMRLDAFFAQYPAFRYEELIDYFNQHGGYNANSLKALLQYHVAKSGLSNILKPH